MYVIILSHVSTQPDVSDAILHVYCTVHDFSFFPW